MTRPLSISESDSETNRLIVCQSVSPVECKAGRRDEQTVSSQQAEWDVCFSWRNQQNLQN